MKSTLQFPQNFSRIVRLITLALLALSLAVGAQAQTLNYLAAFDGVNGSQPSTVIQATDGNFYAATAGHTAGLEYGNVVKITPAAEISPLYNFCSKPNP